MQLSTQTVIPSHTGQLHHPTQPTAQLLSRPPQHLHCFATQKVKASTLANYNNATKHLTSWWTARKQQVIQQYPHLRLSAPTWQLTPTLFVNFLVDLYASGRAYATANECRSALALHLATTPIPKHQWLTESPLVKMALKSYQKRAQPGQRRFPIRGYILHPIARAFFHLYPTTTAQYLTLALYLSYYCLLRVNELCHLHWHHLQWISNHLSLYLGATKGDQQALHPHLETTQPCLIQMIAYLYKHQQPDPITLIPFTPS